MKDEVSLQFKEVLAALPRGVCVRVVCSDCGSEFVRSEFGNVLHKHSIWFETTPPYTPEYNSVAERSGCMAMEMVRVMLKASRMLQPLWAEALAYTTRLINYTPMTATCGCSPHELWVRSRPRLATLHPFGADMYLHIPRHLCNKLDDAARLVCYLGPVHEASHHCVWVTNM